MKTKEPKYEYDKEYRILWREGLEEELKSATMEGYKVLDYLKEHFEGKIIPHWIEEIRKESK